MREWINNIIYKYKKLFEIMSFILAVILCVFLYIGSGWIIEEIGCSAKEYSLAAEQKGKTNLQESLAEEVLRFHVIANSDSKEDQEIKLLVKEAVVDYLEPLLNNVEDVKFAKEIIQRELENITLTAEKKLQELGAEYGARAELSKSLFPVKQYGDIVLPPGEYEALRVLIGKADGKNWWCIMFPQLCFVDSTYTMVPDESKEKLKLVLTEEEYQAILQEVPKITVRFKLWDWIMEVFG